MQTDLFREQKSREFVWGGGVSVAVDGQIIQVSHTLGEYLA